MQVGAGAGTRTRMSVGSGDFKSFVYRGLERDHLYTSYRRCNLAEVGEEAVLPLLHDGCR